MFFYVLSLLLLPAAHAHAHTIVHRPSYFEFNGALGYLNLVGTFLNKKHESWAILVPLNIQKLTHLSRAGRFCIIIYSSYLSQPELTQFLFLRVRLC